jgi:signal transduction histidine kinase
MWFEAHIAASERPSLMNPPSMSTPQALYFIGPPGPARDACSALGEHVRSFDDEAAFTAAEDKSPGLVVLSALEECSALTLLHDLWEAGAGWTLAVADGGDPPMLRTLSLGLPAGTETLAGYLAGEVGGQVTLVDLREALIQIAKTRHDVNNPLTAAVAEVQILLMDSGDDLEAQEGLLVVQEQLRRIRDLLAATRHLHLPRQ